MTTRSKPIAILGWYGSENAGDEAALQSVVQSLCSHGVTNLLVLSTNPAKTAARYGVGSVSRSPLSLATLRAVWNAGALVLGGGGLIQDSSSVYNLPLYAFYVALARLRGISVVGWGLGVGPLSTRLGALLARFICHSSCYFSVRDGGSRHALLSAGVRAEYVRVSADPAFLIEPEQEGGRANPIDKPTKPTVVFCVRHRLHDSPGLNLRYLLPVSVRHRLGLETTPGAGEDARFTGAVARGVAVCVREFGAQVVLLPFWAERDDEALAAVHDKALEMGVPGECISWARVEHTPSELAAYLSGADLLVSMRLHALIFAANAGTPMLALSYVPKMSALMRLLGAEQWVVEVQTRVPPAEEIELKLRRLWASKEGEAARLRGATGRLRERARLDAEAIARLL